MDENSHFRLLELHYKPMHYQNLELFLFGRIVHKKIYFSLAYTAQSTTHATRGVHGLGQPKKPVKPTKKNPKKWVG